ncbi:MAG: tetratricopeptide repeat protein, partial [Rubricoccaceae bacterium]|nr:tetratricopeptide repeat protein [Rubricoccaceae bacterium]
MKHFRLILTSALVLSASVLISACDGGDADLDDIQALLADARIARQAGDLPGAIAILESAHDQAPENAPVRIELASAYMEQEGVDLLDLDRIALYLTNFEDNLAGTGTNTAAVGKTCQYESDPNAQPFELRDYEEYLELFDARTQINEVIALLNESPQPVVPAELRALGLCSGISDGELDYDRDAALGEMETMGLTEDEITTA